MIDDNEPSRPLLALNVGNTRTTFAVFRGAAREHLHALPNEPFDALARAVVDHARELAADDPAVAIASTNAPLADRLASAIHAALPLGADAPLRLRRDLPVPIRHTLDDAGERTVGDDRLLNALAAFAVVRQACVVVDAGTAITVDFVDGEGTYHGGAILPGARMMLRALHEQTSALPLVELALPDSLAPGAAPFGRNTPQAMLNGVVFAARGAVRALAERYAESYEAYPQILATGGDAALLFQGDELIEAHIPDLTLRGLAQAWRAAAGETDE